MRTIDPVTLVIKPSNIAWWHSSWTGRFVLAALFVAAAAFALMPDRASALHDNTTNEAHCDSDDVILNSAYERNPGLIADCVALLTAGQSLTETSTNEVDWIYGEEVFKGLGEDVGGIPNNWDGVTLSQMENGDWRITAVNLIDDGNNNAVAGGTLAPEWGDLTELTALNISTTGTNRLTGTMPKELAKLTKLTTLNLSGNNLSGSIPSGLASLTALTTLDLSDNDLEDPIPGELANLTKLTTLNLSGNSLTGSIPDAWASGFDSLTTLNLSDNDLSGTVPRAVWKHLVGTPGSNQTGPNLTDSAGLNLSGNPNLHPSPPLGATAVVEKEDAEDTKVTLTWDHTGWYTRTEATDTTTLSYRLPL